MEYFQKTWVRVIVSLLAGGILTEILSMHSTDPNHLTTPDRSSQYTLLAGFLIYIVFTAVIKKTGRKQ